MTQQQETASLSSDGDDEVLPSSSSSSSSEEPNADAHKTTPRQAFTHLLKGYVGPGCLSLPWAVSQFGNGNRGISLGCLVIAAVAYWTSYNCWTVVQLKQQLVVLLQQQQQQQQSNNPQPNNNNNSNSNNNNHVTFPGLARWLWGRRMERFLLCTVCVQQLAVCTVFLSFLGLNLQAVLESVVSVSHVTVITLALPSVLALSCLPDLKALAPVILAATVAFAVGLGLLSSLVAVEWHERPQTAATDRITWNTVPLAICAVLYSFEGVCLILPVQSSMREPRHFKPVFVAAMTASAVIFCLVAGLSVAAFGTVTSGSITAFLLEKYNNSNDDDDDESSNAHLHSMVLLANAAVSFSVLITYPLQLFPCFELVGPLVASCCSITKRRRRRQHDHVQLTITTTPTANGEERGDFCALALEDEHETNDSAVIVMTSRHADDDDDDEIQVSEHTDDDGAIFHQEEEYQRNNNNNIDEDEIILSSSSTSSGDTPMGRAMLVLLTYILAIAVPNVESMISLAGALAGSTVALLVPPAMQIEYCRQNNDITNTAVVVRSYILLALGIVFLVVGTTASILDIVKIYASK